MKKDFEPVLILLDIRSAQNVGAIFRTADAVGVSQIYLIGITPTPLDKFGRERGDIAKSALGSEKSMPWKYAKTVAPVLKKLKEAGYANVAIEQDEKSEDYKKIKASPKTAFIVGNEVTGVPKSVLQKCDHIAQIPMLGMKESLNVSVATGIALFRILDN